MIEFYVRGAVIRLNNCRRVSGPFATRDSAERFAAGLAAGGQVSSVVIEQRETHVAQLRTTRNAPEPGNESEP